MLWTDVVWPKGVHEIYTVLWQLRDEIYMKWYLNRQYRQDRQDRRDRRSCVAAGSFPTNYEATFANIMVLYAG